MAYKSFKITQAPKRIELRIPNSLGEVNPALFVLNKEYPIEVESEIKVQPYLGYPSEPIDLFKYKIKPSETEPWSDNINFEINVIPSPGTPSCTNKTQALSVGVWTDITHLFVFDSSTDRIRIDSIEGRNTLFVNGIPFTRGKTYMIYEFVNVTYHALNPWTDTMDYMAKIYFTMGRKSEWGASCMVRLNMAFITSLMLLGEEVEQSTPTFSKHVWIRGGIPGSEARISFTPSQTFAFLEVSYIDEFTTTEVVTYMDPTLETIVTFPITQTGSQHIYIKGAPLLENQDDPYFVYIDTQLLDSNGTPDQVDELFDFIRIPIYNDADLIKDFNIINGVTMSSSLFVEGTVVDSHTVEVESQPVNNILAAINLYPNYGTPPFTYAVTETSGAVTTITPNVFDPSKFDIDGLTGDGPGIKHSFLATVTDANAVVSTRPFDLTVVLVSAQVAVPVVTPPANLDVPQNNYVSVLPTATNGPITLWAATNLPTGLSINATTGRITGYATAIAVTVVGITATNSFGVSTSANWTLTVVENTDVLPVITSAATANWPNGVGSSYVVTYTGTEPVTLSIPDLPSGWYFNQVNKTLFGTLTIPQQKVTLTATNSKGVVTKTLTIYRT